MSAHLLSEFKFILSCAKLSQLPTDTGAEVAFIGRSNAGKSSALNAMAGHKLAFTSKTPGRTQLMNVFAEPDDLEKRCIDLPGYGYAKVPPHIQQEWAQILPQYFAKRQSLMGLILIMDIRHPLKPMDVQMLEYLHARGLPTHILLSKADKLSRAQQNAQLFSVQKALAPSAQLTSVQLFSAPHKIGVDDANRVMQAWLVNAPVEQNG